MCMCEGHVCTRMKCMCVHVWTCAWVKYMCVLCEVHVCACAYEGQKTTLAVIPQDLFLLVFITRSLTSLGATE